MRRGIQVGYTGVVMQNVFLLSHLFQCLVTSHMQMLIKFCVISLLHPLYVALFTSKIWPHASDISFTYTKSFCASIFDA